MRHASSRASLDLLHELDCTVVLSFQDVSPEPRTTVRRILQQIWRGSATKTRITISYSCSQLRAGLDMYKPNIHCHVNTYLNRLIFISRTITTFINRPHYLFSCGFNYCIIITAHFVDNFSHKCSIIVVEK